MGVVWGDTMEQPVCPLRGLGIRSCLQEFMRALNSRLRMRVRP